jgi:RNA polymerase sigma-70 factor (family 1)
MKTEDYKAEEYLYAFRQGLERGFNFFFREYYASLSYFSYNYTNDRSIAEEIAGETLMKLWELHKNFDNLQAIRSFLYDATRNASLNWIRSQKRNSRKLNELSYLTEDLERNSFEQIVEAETYRETLSALKALPPQCRKIFQMLFLEGKNCQQIAKELNLSISTIRNQKARALSLIRQRIAFVSIFIILFF